MLIECIGKCIYQPAELTKKHISQSEWLKTALLVTECDLHLYYAWFIQRRFNLKLNPPIRGTHITFISDRIENDEDYVRSLEKYDNKEILFYIDPDPRTNGAHWWLRAYSSDAEDARELAGLKREPHFPFHMTIGMANEKNIEHSKYILEQCKRFELIPNTPRLPFEQHEIIRLNEII